MPGTGGRVADTANVRARSGELSSADDLAAELMRRHAILTRRSVERRLRRACRDPRGCRDLPHWLHNCYLVWFPGGAIPLTLHACAWYSPPC
jgi:hypothetical protein